MSQARWNPSQCCALIDQGLTLYNPSQGGSAKGGFAQCVCTLTCPRYAVTKTLGDLTELAALGIRGEVSAEACLVLLAATNLIVGAVLG